MKVSSKLWSGIMSAFIVFCALGLMLWLIWFSNGQFGFDGLVGRETSLFVLVFFAMGFAFCLVMVEPLGGRDSAGVAQGSTVVYQRDLFGRGESNQWLVGVVFVSFGTAIFGLVAACEPTRSSISWGAPAVGGAFVLLGYIFLAGFTTLVIKLGERRYLLKRGFFRSHTGAFQDFERLDLKLITTSCTSDEGPTFYSYNLNLKWKDSLRKEVRLLIFRPTTVEGKADAERKAVGESQKLAATLKLTLTRSKLWESYTPKRSNSRDC